MFRSITLFGWVRFGVWMLLACILMKYGIFVRNAATGSSFYRIWFLGAGCFLFLAAAVLLRIWERLPKGLRIAVAAIAVAGILMVTVVELLVYSRFNEPEKDADYIIVLGAQVREDGPSLVLRYRLDKAIAYLEAHPDTVCIVSGGLGDNEPYTEAEGMRRYLTENGVDAERILLEDRSVNTATNMEYSLKLLPSADVTVGIVTNNFHMYRSMKIAEKKGMVNAIPICADSKKEFLPNNLFREFFGVMKDWIFGNM